MQLGPDLRAFLACLNAEGVRYLVVGGYAVAAHGHPRYTKDLDVWLDATPGNAQRVLAALDRFGFAGLDLQEADFTSPGSVVQLGYPPQRVDLLTDADGVDFETCHTARWVLELDGLPVPFIDLANLRRNKLASGRPRDLADLDDLPPSP
jgi:hypothetical protein